MILAAAAAGRSFGATALAVHGLVLGARDAELGALIDRLDLVLPDGQPVRWAMNRLHGTGLTERVYGPTLMEGLCAAAARRRLPIYLYGSTGATCAKLARALQARWPELVVAGVQPDRFRDATPEEDAADVARIRGSGARIVFVGRGCPRQERWVAAHLGRVDAAMVAVGAAFDYLAGNLPRPPRWMQDRGLEWLWRLTLEPRRLLRRYLVTNALFCWLVAWQALRHGRGAARP